MSQEELRRFLLDNKFQAQLGRAKLIDLVGVDAAGDVVLIRYVSDQSLDGGQK